MTSSNRQFSRPHRHSRLRGNPAADRQPSFPRKRESGRRPATVIPA